MAHGRLGGWTFSSETPHFFKIILEESLREKRLLIPKKFVRLYGETLSDFVDVKLPCGSKWKMELSKQEGKVWLRNGWEEFAKHYSIVRGHLLVFRYEGNSRFDLVIFDTSAVEIDYPSSMFSSECGIGLKARGDQRKAVKDASSDILDDIQARPRTRKRSPLSRSHPRKKMRTSPAEPESNFKSPKPKGSVRNKRAIEISHQKRKRNNSRSSKPKMEGKYDSPSKRFGKKSTTNKISEITRSTKPWNRTEKIAALEKASDFTSDRPFFKVVIQPYYVRCSNMNLPTSFAKTYLERKSGTAILMVPKKRRKTWPVKYSSVVCKSGISLTRFHSGWKEFVRSNNLEIGDVCVFVLLKGREVSFKVVVFRDNVIENVPNLSALRRGAHKVEQEESSRNESESGVNKDVETNTLNLSDDLPEKQENRRKSTLRKTSLESQGIRQKTTLSKIEKDRILERAHFVSDKPFFKVVMQPSFVSPGRVLPIPLHFAERYIKNEGEIVLWTPNSMSSSVNFKIWRLKSRQSTAHFFDGWESFVQGNNLEVGDVCIFELVDGTEVSFKVSIVRIFDDAYHHQSQAFPDQTLENDSRSCDAIEKQTSILNARENSPEKRASRSMSSVGKTSQSPAANMRGNLFSTIEKTRRSKVHFDSDNPFFKVVMQRSYAGVRSHLPIPNDFAQRHFKNQDVNVILRVLKGTRTWYAQFKRRRLATGQVTAEITNGWKKFSQCNNLKARDVCIFELVDETEMSFEISIFRDSLNQIP